MTAHPIPLRETNQFSPLFLDYLDQKPALRPFYGHFPHLDNFAAQMREKVFPPESRATLAAALVRQYATVANPPDLAALRQANTYTVTTGHQLNIFAGPLYVIYKLATVVNLANALRARYPDCQFVPVYWMATEDHDFAEINHFDLFGKTHAWQTNQRGAVGRMDPRELTDLLAQLPEKVPTFERAYLEHDTLAAATRAWAHELFGAHGLVCVDGDDAALKAPFIPALRDDLTRHPAFELVTTASQQLDALGYRTQVNAREINCFYLADGVRERITLENGTYRVLNTDLQFTEAELLALLDRAPEHFSPNVVLRPLYQETILPNLAYIGGPAEVAYWLQLKPLFAHAGVPFPALLPRNFGLVVNQGQARRLQKLGLTVADLFVDEANLKRRLVTRNGQAVDLTAELAALDQAFDAIVAKAVKLDKTLEGFVLAERQKVRNGVENVDKRLRKAEEKNQETDINQLLALKAKLFPNGGLQERTDNYLNFALNDPDFLPALLRTFDPLHFVLYALVEDQPGA